jgi:hypothetical protein
MNINITWLVTAYFISLFVDWIFQWNWQAVNKSKWNKGNRINAFMAVASHSLIYAIITSTVLIFIFNYNYFTFSIIWDVLFVSHLLIDTRIPVKWIMRFKGMSWEQINDYQNYGFMHIGIDHRLHELVLLVLAFFVK